MLIYSDRIIVADPNVLRNCMYARLQEADHKGFDIDLYDDRTKDINFRINFVRNKVSEFNISIYKLDKEFVADISWDETPEAIALQKFVKMSIENINNPLFAGKI